MAAVNEIREGLNGFKGAVRLKVLFFVDSHPFFKYLAKISFNPKMTIKLQYLIQ